MTLEWQMPEVPADASDPRIQAALDELRAMIPQRYPAANFTVTRGEDPEGVYLNPIVDVEDLDEVADVVTDRLVDMQVEEGLPIYVVPEWPTERLRAYLQQAAKRIPVLPIVTLP